MSKRRVFVLNDGGHDYSGAAEFGEVIVCSEGMIPKNDVAQMFRILNPFLELSHKDDLIVIGSLASMVGVASAIMAGLHGEVHYLVFGNGRYAVKDLMV